MSKLLWHSNAPWTPTGYGQQTGLFAPLLKEHYDLAISSFYGLEGSPITWGGIPVFPGVGGVFGDEHLVQHAKRFFDGDPRGGLVTTLMDVWVLDPRWMEQVNVASWVPVDHEPAPPNVVKFFVDTGAVPIAMSRFGQAMLGRLDPLYCPHGIDTSTFKPVPKAKAREEAGVPQDAFLVGMVAANKGRPSRKGFSQALQAFKRLSDAHDNVYLYLHTMINPGVAQGEDIPALLEACGIPQERVMIADQYRVVFDPYPPDSMAKAFSTMDVLLNPAMGEGFGITVLEAQACGVPVIVTDFTAMRETTAEGMWRVKHSPYWTGLGSWQAIPDVDDIVSALEDCYSMPRKQRQQLQRQAREHAVKYDLQTVFKDHMLPALRQAEQRFSRQNVIQIAPRKLELAA
jgi:glycosyltransferase involved in cell wall biosynthesis